MKKTRKRFLRVLFLFPDEKAAKRAQKALRDMEAEIQAADASSGRNAFWCSFDLMLDWSVFSQLEYMMRQLTRRRVCKLNKRIQRIEVSVKTALRGRTGGDWVDLPGKSIDIDHAATGRQVVSALQLKHATLSAREFDTVLIKYDEVVSRVLVNVELYELFREISRADESTRRLADVKKTARYGVRIARENIW